MRPPLYSYFSYSNIPPKRDSGLIKLAHLSDHNCPEASWGDPRSATNLVMPDPRRSNTLDRQLSSPFFLHHKHRAVGVRRDAAGDAPDGSPQPTEPPAPCDYHVGPYLLAERDHLSVRLSRSEVYVGDLPAILLNPSHLLIEQLLSPLPVLFVQARACYELGRKSHRNADFTVSLVSSRSLFPAFLSH